MPDPSQVKSNLPHSLKHGNEGQVKDYVKLRELLIEQNDFPTKFIVKFIGKNSSLFNSGVQNFESQNSTLVQISKRESANGAHVALTYHFPAESADAIISMLKRVAEIQDVEIVL